LRELRLGDLALARALMDVRTFPLRLLRRARPRPRIVTGRFLEHGPVPVLAEEAHRAILAGGLLQPWKLGGGAEPPMLDAPGLRDYAEPGWVKCGVDFVLVAADGGTRLSTETRVRATDRRTGVKFAAYWLAIRAGSGLIRREMLRVVARRAERTPVRA
jgi:hypothetical protein